MTSADVPGCLDSVSASTVVPPLPSLTYHNSDAIPRAKWNSRFFDPTDPDTSYDSFISGPATEVKSSGLRWNVPARGEVKEADKLISRLVSICDLCAY